MFILALNKQFKQFPHCFFFTVKLHWICHVCYGKHFQKFQLKGVISELEEIRAQKEHTGLQSENINRIQTKQLAEHQASIKALQVRQVYSQSGL